MQLNIVQGSIQENKADTLIVNLFEGVRPPSGATGAVDRALNGAISEMVASGDLTGKAGEVGVVYTRGAIPAKRVLVVGLGKQEDLNLEGVRQAAGTAIKRARDLNAKDVATVLHGAGAGGLEISAVAQAVAEGTLLALYVFDMFKSKPEPKGEIQSFTIVEAGKIDAAESGVRLAETIAAGVYLTRVIRTKRSRGVDIAICDGGMHHHLAAAGHLGTLIQRNYRMHKVTSAPELAATESYTLVGPLCTTIDTIGRQVTLPRLAAGDLIALESSGAYGPTVSPVHFISHPLPREVLVETVDGNLLVEDASQFAVESTRP